MSAVEVREVSHRYGRRPALDRVSFAVPEGAIYGLIGPNGAGKTTALRIICTLLVPTSGDAVVQGNSARQAPEAIRRQLGYMPDAFGSYGELRVWEYLDFYARCYKLEPATRRRAIADVLELVDLAERRDSYVQGLSRGMAQRLALARTLLHDPAVLVLDEPASGLDPRARIELRTLLRELQRLGKTILLSSHILADLAEICSHVAILSGGKLAVQGTLAEVLARVQPTRQLTVEFLATGTADAITAAAPELSEPVVTAASGRLLLRGRFTGDDAALAALLARLVAAGLPVVAFREELSALEDVFMQLTQPGAA